MPIPYATDQANPPRALATVALLALNAALAVGVFAGAAAHVWTLGGVWASVGLSSRTLIPAGLITYMFFHESVSHLLVNMLYLWVFGPGVEQALGKLKFVAMYILSGVVGGAAQLLVTSRLGGAQAAEVPILGASAACAGIIGIYAVRYYRARISILFLPSGIHVVLAVCLFLAYEIGMGLWTAAHGLVEAGVAHWAHIAGFTFGLSCANLMRLQDAGQRDYLTRDAALSIAQGSPGGALRRWEHVLAREPDNTGAMAELALAWSALGDLDQARSLAGRAIRHELSDGSRTVAADLFSRALREHIAPKDLTAEELFALGSALAEHGEPDIAAEALRTVATRYPSSPEAEMALLRTLTLYVDRLGRWADADLLVRLFLNRYPQSRWRGMAEDLARRAASHSTGDGGMA